MLRLISLGFVFLLISSTSYASSENLDELAARKSRMATATWGKSFLENPTTQVWQPETLVYTDITTGHEVWRLTSTKGTQNSLPDLDMAQFSADGKRLAFGSNRLTSAGNCDLATNTNPTYQGTSMIMRSDGSYLRPTANGPFVVNAHSRYFHWSPVEPDVYYGFGRNYCSEGLAQDQLYRVTTNDTTISKTMVQNYSTGKEMSIERAFSGDGRKLAVTGNSKFYITTITPYTNTVSLDNASGWAQIRQLDSYWGNTLDGTSWFQHFFAVAGIGNTTKIYTIQEGGNAIWRYALSGPAADGGPLYTVDHAEPYSWGSIEPVITGGGSNNDCVAGTRSPWNCDSDKNTGPDAYLSHNTYDRWGHYTAGVNSQQGRALGVWDLNTHGWMVRLLSVPSYDWHQNWAAWSDYFAASPSGSFSTTDKLYSHKYDGTNSFIVASTHPREAGSTEYNSLPRVTQSPDGTKSVFHSDFLCNTANTWDLFYAVAYYPHPPEITNVTGSETYTIQFDWRLATTPRGYTTRGWPDEATNIPPPPRETKAFRLWRSANVTSGWTPVATVDADVFSRYDFSTGTWKGNDYWIITDTPGVGTWYYAVTAIEHSGLESRTLSNVYSTAGTQTVAYPSNPKEVKQFYAVAPPWPEMTVTKLTIPGQYRLDWKEPGDPIIRYYNIYYSNNSIPKAIQNQRITSIPKGTNTYVDWLADPNSQGYYLITSVDTQGNESAFALRGGIKATLK